MQHFPGRSRRPRARILVATTGLFLALGIAERTRAVDQPNLTYKVFQFPADEIPRIDGNGPGLHNEDFWGGQTSTEQHPLHAYAKPDNYVVILDVEGPDGKSRRSKVWDVQLR